MSILVVFSFTKALKMLLLSRLTLLLQIYYILCQQYFFLKIPDPLFIFPVYVSTFFATIELQIQSPSWFVSNTADLGTFVLFHSKCANKAVK